jgi:hypothetical protein
MKDGKDKGWGRYTLRYCKYEPKLRVLLTSVRRPLCSSGYEKEKSPVKQHHHQDTKKTAKTVSKFATREYGIDDTCVSRFWFSDRMRRALREGSISRRGVKKDNIPFAGLHIHCTMRSIVSFRPPCQAP